LRIAILTHGQSPFGLGYARTFAERRHEVEVWSLSSCEPVPGITMRVLGPQGYRPWESRSRVVPYLKCLPAVRKAVREFVPDVLYALYLSSAGLIGCLSGHPRVVVAALGSDVQTRLESRIWRAILRWECRRARLVQAVSDPLADALRNRIGVESRKILTAPIGVDTQTLAYVETAARPQTGQILCTRHHKPVYDHQTLVRAMARLKARGVRCRLTFTSRMEVEATRRLVRENGVEDSVVFRNGFASEELPGLMAAADVYISASRSDGTSQSLLEAMSTGTFPVVSDIPANRPWVEHGRTGYRFPVGDDAALADRLEEALARPDVRAAAAPLNRQIVLDRGDVNRLTSKLLAAFQALLAE